MSAGDTWTRSDLRKRLLEVYAEADRTLAPFRCEASASCCHFARTGREPSVTIGEWLEVVRAVRAGGRRLPAPPSDSERTCPLLSRDGRCTIYASRPLGCRTYFCSRSTRGLAPVPKGRLRALVSPLRRLAAEIRPADDGPRPLTAWLACWRGKRGKEREGGACRVGGARDLRHPRE